MTDEDLAVLCDGAVAMWLLSGNPTADIVVTLDGVRVMFMPRPTARWLDSNFHPLALTDQLVLRARNMLLARVPGYADGAPVRMSKGTRWSIDYEKLDKLVNLPPMVGPVTVSVPADAYDGYSILLRDSADAEWMISADSATQGLIGGAITPTESLLPTIPATSHAGLPPRIRS